MSRRKKQQILWIFLTHSVKWGKSKNGPYRIHIFRVDKYLHYTTPFYAGAVLMTQDTLQRPLKIFTPFFFPTPCLQARFKSTRTCNLYQKPGLLTFLRNSFFKKSSWEIWTWTDLTWVFFPSLLRMGLWKIKSTQEKSCTTCRTGNICSDTTSQNGRKKDIKMQVVHTRYSDSIRHFYDILEEGKLDVGAKQYESFIRTESFCKVAQADLKLIILLPQPPQARLTDIHHHT